MRSSPDAGLLLFNTIIRGGNVMDENLPVNESEVNEATDEVTENVQEESNEANESNETNNV